jgi:hypothetical protein
MKWFSGIFIKRGLFENFAFWLKELKMTDSFAIICLYSFAIICLFADFYLKNQSGFFKGRKERKE